MDTERNAVDNITLWFVCVNEGVRPWVTVPSEIIIEFLRGQAECVITDWGIWKSIKWLAVTGVCLKWVMGKVCVCACVYLACN